MGDDCGETNSFDIVKEDMRSPSSGTELTLDLNFSLWSSEDTKDPLLHPDKDLESLNKRLPGVNWAGGLAKNSTGAVHSWLRPLCKLEIPQKECKETRVKGETDVILRDGAP